MTIWFGPGFGIGESMILTLGPLETMASFIVLDVVLAVRTCEEMEESLLEADMRRRESIGCRWMRRDCGT